MMKNHSLFTREKEVLQRCESVLKEESHKDSPLYEEYKQLQQDYSKLFRQFSRIVKMSDKQQDQLRETQESITRYNEELKQLNATKDKFFSIISHDLKSPFQAFLNLNTFLVQRFDRYSREEIIELITDLGDTATNLFKLLENLLSWSRIQMGKMQFSPDIYPLKQVYSTTLELLTSTAKDKEIEIIDRTANDILVLTDPDMLNTIMRNLVSNAIKFTESGGTITVNAETKGDDVIVSVSDTGVGMTEEERASLFRIDSTHTTPGTRDEKGTGLGLILCKDMVEMHKGSIWVESVPEEGTTFCFSLKKQ